MNRSYLEDNYIAVLAQQFKRKLKAEKRNCEDSKFLAIYDYTVAIDKSRAPRRKTPRTDRISFMILGGNEFHYFSKIIAALYSECKSFYKHSFIDLAKSDVETIKMTKAGEAFFNDNLYYGIVYNQKIVQLMLFGAEETKRVTADIVRVSLDQAVDEFTCWIATTRFADMTQEQTAEVEKFVDKFSRQRRTKQLAVRKSLYRT